MCYTKEIIPKKKNFECPADFRHISLCNVTYKVVTKINANHLRPFLGRLISPLQGAFVLGRHITDNIIVVYELFYSMKKIRGRSRAFTLKFDMSKAYDRLVWPFISRSLKEFGFNEDIHYLIMSRIQSASFSIILAQWKSRDLLEVLNKYLPFIFIYIMFKGAFEAYI